MSHPPTKITIIGAGPAGLAIAGRLSRRGIPYTILEASPNISNSWRNHYDRLHLHTVKQWSHLPHKPFPDEYPLYVPKDLLVEYFESYANEFKINPIFNTKITNIIKSNGHWQLEEETGNVRTSDVVIIATGVNHEPNIPTFEGQTSFSGSIKHSFTYKNTKPYKGKKVLVIGMGNTGAEIALDLAEAGIDTYLSVRGPVNIVPRDLNGRPVQVTAKKLAKIPFGLGTKLGVLIRSFYIGDLSKYGIPSPKMGPTEQLLETGKTPVVDIGTVAAIKKGIIKVYQGIKQINKHSVTFTDGKTQEITDIILATGYKPKVENFLEKGEEILDKYGCPNPPIGKGFHDNIYFLGFDNYKLGGILGIIMEESKLVADHIENKTNT
jgi:cation diffusion facilitator CzcD-associated flavoprotein CzcO